MLVVVTDVVEVPVVLVDVVLEVDDVNVLVVLVDVDVLIVTVVVRVVRVVDVDVTVLVDVLEVLVAVFVVVVLGLVVKSGAMAPSDRVTPATWTPTSPVVTAASPCTPARCLANVWQPEGARSSSVDRSFLASTVGGGLIVAAAVTEPADSSTATWLLCMSGLFTMDMTSRLTVETTTETKAGVSRSREYSRF
mmetsp:Transcript_132446/g.369250  ORF Transcript_132446/g.369250 Transcript_132446/m.369250 type:complete len:193 (+) Transcript_132446:1534-2112(+)